MEKKHKKTYEEYRKGKIVSGKFRLKAIENIISVKKDQKKLSRNI